MAASLNFLLLLISSVLLASQFSVYEAANDGLLANGLSIDFHKSTCPQLESIVRTQLKKVYKQEIGQAAGILRLHFHDCFVRGCDASVLFDGSASGPSEKDTPPNFTLRPEAFKIIEDLRERIHSKCGRVVSCADITTLATRDAIFLSGGPDYKVPLGRRDGLNFATRNETLANLPGPSSTADFLLRSLGNKTFDATEVVALSGAHTIGRSHCNSFTRRLYPNQDPTMDQTFAKTLKSICPELNTNTTTFLDLRTPNTFDNKYYIDLINRQGLFTSDQDLFTDKRTSGIVKSFAENQSLFFDKFVQSMIKMSQLNVLTGNQGEIRAKCSVRNKDNASLIKSVGEEVVEDLSVF
ncbi:Peroxidase [Quillaja saponaria]|uniref:Peroxidase n=1 Tax=Quillaja saponaria TaxID=32244 RepID=A0AAD7Q377_QUISA|nr:Peroxidase [Quillaja saponaria]